MTERGEVITLLDEEGDAHEFNLVDVVELDSRRYAILQPTDEEDAAVVFRVEDDTLVAIEDEEEFNRVVQAIEAAADYDEVEVTDADAADDDEDDAGDDRSKVM